MSIRTSIAKEARLGFAVLAVLAIITGVANYFAERALSEKGVLAGREMPRVFGQILEAELLVTRAHIVIEEIVGGDAAEAPDEVWQMLDEAVGVLKAAEPESMRIFGNGLSPRFQAAFAGIDELRRLAEGRFSVARSGSGVGSGADEEFDGLFDSLTSRLAGVAADPSVAHSADIQRLLGQARYRLAAGHLVVEEVLGGDGGEDFGEALAVFDQAAADIEAVAAMPLANGVRTDLEAASGDVGRFSFLATTRYDASREREAATAAGDVTFDATFEAFVASMAEFRGELSDDMDGIVGDMQTVAARILAVSAGASVIVLLTIFALYRRITTRIVARLLDVNKAMGRYARGDLESPLPRWTSQDELGALRDTLEVFRNAQTERIVLEEENREAMVREREAAREMAELEAAKTAEDSRRAEDEKRRLREEREMERQYAQQIARVVSSYAGGDFAPRLVAEKNSGVFGEVAEGLNRIGEATDAALSDILSALGALAEGRLTYRTRDGHKGMFHELAAAADSCAAGLRDTIGLIGGSGAAVRGSAEEIASAADDLSRRSERAATMLEETASALEEIATAIHNAQSASEEVDQSVQGIRGRAVEGRAIVIEAVNAMVEIESSSQAISRIIEVIDGISFQTNLLALNAGVEAARAGDAGRGFAVVASEVRALASRSSEASLQIAELIAQSGRHVETGVGLVNRTGDALNQIAEAVIGMSERVAGIATAARETAKSVSEITSSAAELDRATQQNAAMFEETTAAVRVLLSEAEVLAEATGSFDVGQVDDDGAELRKRA